MKRHEAQLHSSETPYKCRCSYHWYCYWCIKVFWILSKTLILFSRCDRTFKSEYSWKRHQSNDEVHEKMENYKPFLTCEVSNHITPSKKLPKEFFTTHAHCSRAWHSPHSNSCVLTSEFRFAENSLRGGDDGALTSTCSAMRLRGSSSVTSVRNTSGTLPTWKLIGRLARGWRCVSAVLHLFSLYL